MRRFGAERPLDGVGAAELRAWLLELRQTLAPESIAGYVRGLKVFGNWCAAEELGTAAGFRALRRPRVPRRIIAPFTDAELQRLLAIAEPRERALILLLLDTGLRLAEVTCHLGVHRVITVAGDPTHRSRFLPDGQRRRTTPLRTRIAAAAVTHALRRGCWPVRSSAALLAPPRGAGFEGGEPSVGETSTIPGHPASPPAIHRFRRLARIANHLPGRISTVRVAGSALLDQPPVPVAEVTHS